MKSKKKPKNTTLEIFEPNNQRAESNAKTKSRNDIVITDAYKGGAVVILDVEDSVKEAESKRNNKENYREIIYDPTTANNETIHKVISRFQKENLLSKNITEGLKTENPMSPHFYLKPKVHK